MAAISVISFIGLAAAQDSMNVMRKDVPETVLTAFGKAYPKAIPKSSSKPFPAKRVTAKFATNLNLGTATPIATSSTPPTAM